MAASEERLKILTMIQEGKLSPEEGIRLLEILDETHINADKAQAEGPTPRQAAKGARWLHVRVTDTDTDKVRVNIRVPVSVVTTGLKMGARFSPEIDGISASQLIELIRSGETGQVIDVYDDADGEHVEVFIE